MNPVEAFEIDDDFDPLADLESDEDENTQDVDYLPPIPDAELSRMPEVIPLTPAEHIKKLITGIPGQHHRLLHAVAFCAEPHTLSEIVVALDAAFPNDVSVYDASQIVQLLEEAGALESESSEATVPDETPGNDPAEAHEHGTDGTPTQDRPGIDYLVVEPAAARLYRATEAGATAVAESCGEHVVYAAITDDDRYLPLYRTILEMTSAPGGCATKELDAVIDGDPLCVEPRRYCGYFLGRLENAGAIAWRDAWIITDLGKTVLASAVFTD